MTRLERLAQRLVGEVGYLIIWPAVVLDGLLHERRLKTLRATTAYLRAVNAVAAAEATSPRTR